MRQYRRLAAAIAVAAACYLGGGSLPARAADTVSETRSVPAFDRIELRGAFKATITAGAERAKVVVNAKSSTLARITTDVKDRTLVVGMRSGSNLDGDFPRLTIAVPALRAFSISGAATATIVGLTGDDVELENDGAGTITASGRAAKESIALNGAGKIDATGVDARDVTVDNNGVGGIYVRASGQLTMSVNGVGEIRYTGHPAHVDSQVNGIGRIERM